MARMNKHRLWLMLIILAGLALRLLWLGEQSLWYDEGVTWMLSKMQLPDLIQWTAADIQPPLYYLLIWLNDILLRDSEFALRWPSVLFGVLSIPAIYALARRLFANRLAPLLAAALLAGSPLLVYYSQEARMYTLLVFEAILASYFLVKIVTRHSSLVTRHSSLVTRLSSFIPCPLKGGHPSAFFYAFTAAAALYTHYFAAFLLLAHGLFAALVWQRRRFERDLLGQLLGAFGGALLLFAPWLPVLLARLGDDPSYWPGALKLNEAARKLLISFTAGETVFEQTGWWLALAYLAGLLLCAAWAVWSQRVSESASQRVANGELPLASSAWRVAGDKLRMAWSITHPTQNSKLKTQNSKLLLLWLLLPPSLILALSYQSPKFNPRYALLSWPAFALIVAGVLGELLAAAAAQKGARRAVSWLLPAALALFIAGLSAFSLSNWFSDPRFSKADFKAVAQFVRERRAPDETVLLSSGHLFPVWAYYYGWDGWTPLPWMLRLDVGRVTDVSIAGKIAEAVQNKGGAWLVTWQNEVIDPTGVVPFWLDRIGERPHDAGDFWGVGLEHWRLKPDKIELLSQNPIKRAVNANFNNQLDLVGMTQLSDDELVLFWRPRQPLPDKLTLTLRLTDGDGFLWDTEPLVAPLGPATYPPSRWPVGELVITRLRLPWQTGTPPGLYVAEVGLGTVDGQNFSGWDVLDSEGRPQRRTALVDAVNLSRLVQPPNGPLPQDTSPLVDLFPIIGLRRSILPVKSAQPGDRLLLALLWQAGQYNLDDVSLAFDLVDAAGQTFRVGQSLTPSRRFNLPRWQPGDMALGQYRLAIPPEAAPGPAELRVHIINVGAFDYDEVYPFDQLEILPTERNFSPPAAVDIPLAADFSGQATLLGVDCPGNCAAAPGQSLNLTLYWRAEAPFDTTYTVFTHLLGADETVLVNADHAPPKPTTGWVPGEIIADPVTLNLPANLPPGDYTLEIGLYNAADPAFARLPLTTGETRLLLPQPLHVK
ncbi:MAG: hypothetical protein FOGNACKC_02346 [Anaerolineae bacterium]|nr:hypothetical protein [Anaerolineae bacterium]